MTNTLYAIGGVVFILLILPIIQTLADMVCTFFQWAISAINLKIATNNVEIQNLQESIVPENTNLIGFQMPDEYPEEYYDDEEYGDTDDKGNPMAKIGFRV